MKKTFFVLNFVIIASVIASLSVLNSVFAWTEPASAPPSGNVDAPINVGSKLQSKAGGLGLNGADASNKHGLSVNTGTETAIQTYNASNSAEVVINKSTAGVNINATKKSYNGVYSWIGGADSNAAYLVNTDLSGRGLYALSEGVGGIITGDEMGLLVTSANTGLKTTSEKIGLISQLEKNSAKVSETKLNFSDANNNPVGAGVYSYKTDGTTTNSYAELGRTDIGIKAQGNQYAGYFEGPVYMSGTLTLGKGCNGCKDLAEAMTMAERVEAGDIVAVDAAMRLVRAAKRDKTVIGVVSTEPAMTLNSAAEINGAPVALSGIVTVKVTNENGAIRAGDFITASSIVGFGMKATEAGTVVGKALENFNGRQGTIKIFVDLGWFGADCGK
ncbi:hypothetical protein HZB94_04365 [Candidatus Falkowbacteria bacterium]|nr:hypothetical protein [Candidatus Falkowbacteria bacterium]